jgi:hypothetical protein
MLLPSGASGSSPACTAWVADLSTAAIAARYAQLVHGFEKILILFLYPFAKNEMIMRLHERAYPTDFALFFHPHSSPFFRLLP